MLRFRDYLLGALSLHASVGALPASRNTCTTVLWDGGLVANNPVLAAIGELSRFVALDKLPFRVLSFGTGFRNIQIDAGDWGQAMAAAPVISSLLDVSVGSTNFYLRQLFGDRVIRATPELEFDYAIDDAGVVDRLIKVADDYCQLHLQSTVQQEGTEPLLLNWVKTHW